MSVLLSRSVALSRPFSVPGCGHAVVTVLSSLLILCRLRWENFSRRGAVKWERVRRFQAAGVFSAPLRGDRSVLIAAGEHGPCECAPACWPMATTTTFFGALESRASSHAPIGARSRLIRSTAARAPWIRILRRYTLPRLLMPSSFALPPVEYWRGTMPSHAANSRPLRNAAPLPMAATMAVATTGPIPGILRMRVHPASLAEMRSSSTFSSSICTENRKTHRCGIPNIRYRWRVEMDEIKRDCASRSKRRNYPLVWKR